MSSGTYTWQHQPGSHAPTFLSPPLPVMPSPLSLSKRQEICKLNLPITHIMLAASATSLAVLDPSPYIDVRRNRRPATRVEKVKSFASRVFHSRSKSGMPRFSDLSTSDTETEQCSLRVTPEYASQLTMSELESADGTLIEGFDEPIPGQIERGTSHDSTVSTSFSTESSLSAFMLSPSSANSSRTSLASDWSLMVPMMQEDERDTKPQTMLRSGSRSPLGRSRVDVRVDLPVVENDDDDLRREQMTIREVVLGLGREALEIGVEALDAVPVPAIKGVAIVLLNIWKAYELVKRNKSHCHRLVRRCHDNMNFVHERITVSSVESDRSYLDLPLERLREAFVKIKDFVEGQGGAGTRVPRREEIRRSAELCEKALDDALRILELGLLCETARNLKEPAAIRYNQGGIHSEFGTIAVSESSEIFAIQPYHPPFEDSNEVSFEKGEMMTLELILIPVAPSQFLRRGSNI
ncbi:hypothetical protein BDN72DRAFT_898476 [Pluteus cervinus]|uniref:Uncharacterized protein n=1 Tax=Pluteus cervinus TaxID=181527 RepID=A0ACD3AQP4_9AGAR|nr:hypothetical protein BDN72DRAFT_898476 [Pluteus cervinus]